MLPGFARTRRRTLDRLYTPETVVTGIFQKRHNGLATGNWVFDFVNPAFYGTKFREAQITMDSVHLGPPYTEGGNFLSRRYADNPRTKFSPRGVMGIGTYTRADQLQRYIGGFAPPPPERFHPAGPDRFAFEALGLENLLTEVSVDKPSMGTWGDKAWSRTKPKLEKASGFVFGRESRDIPKMLMTSAAAFGWKFKSMGGRFSSTGVMTPHYVADQFLNQQFGWMPFISDLRKFNDLINDYSKLKYELTAKNGKWVRQRVTLQTETISTRLAFGTGAWCSPGLWNTTWCSTKAQWELFQEVETSVTAVGCFKFYRPEFDSSDDKYMSKWNEIMRMITLSGFRVNPINIYKSTPWTWAMDWVSNLGDHIGQLNDELVDSIANKYLYVMQSKKTTRRHHEVYPFKNSPTLALDFERVIESKERQEGTSPYGFSLTPEDLSPRQLLIALALGVMRT